MISAVQNNSAQNRPAFGNTKFGVISKITGEIIAHKLSFEEEATFLIKLKNDATKWKYNESSRKGDLKYYQFKNKQGDILELQPARGAKIPTADVSNPNHNEHLFIASHENLADLPAQQTFFDQMAEAFMALVPKKPKNEEPKFGHIV